MLPAGAWRILIEENFGTLSYFLIYPLLEWVVIILLFLDGFLAFLSNEFARFFKLKTPCLLCTRLDHLLVQRSSNFYYNESICEVHKRDISTLAYCHAHRRLSDIRSMCQGCLLSSDKDSDCDRRKPLVGDEGNVQLRKHKVDIVANERIGILRCSCCGEPLRLKSKASSAVNNEGGSLDVQAGSYTELKLIADTASELHGDEDDDAAPSSPPRRLDLAVGEGNDAVGRLKRQVTLDRRSLMALYMELDEERSASTVAANNAMAMITRLQEEKAGMQMEALQYQRMMEEQAEYDQEAMQMMNDMLFKREEEMKAMECELEEYRARYGGEGSGLCEVDLDEDVVKSSSEEDELAVLDYKGERCHLLGLLRELEVKMYSEGRKETVAREVALIRGRLRGVEAESEFLKHVAMSLQRGGEGIKVLSEIAQHLREVRQKHDAY